VGARIVAGQFGDRVPAGAAERGQPRRRWGQCPGKTDLTKAYNSAAGQPCTSTLTGDLGGRTLIPGVYCFPSDALLTGTLTLIGEGDPNAAFIIKVGSALTTATGSRVLGLLRPAGIHTFR
jgi:hypothetical protein